MDKALKNKADLDALILGGGIAGLWLARRLQLTGRRVVLLESGQLGGGQTLASQGIIHGGLKYALMGQINDTARRIAEVSREWIAAIEGRGDIDLRGTGIMAEAQHLLVPGGLIGTLAGAMGHAVFGDTIQNLDKSEWPRAAAELGFKGNIVAMKEPGIDVASAIKILAAQLDGVCYHYNPAQLQIERGADGEFFVRIGEVELRARKIISLAANGNDWLGEKIGLRAQSQRRPLRQVMIKGDLPLAFFHAVTASPKPAFTISTHYTADGAAVWYLGGGVAEEGTGQDDATLFNKSAKALKKYLPKLDLKNAAWAAYPVDRVEGLDPQGRLPERPSYQQHENVTLAWVNKLTFAPLLAREILAQMPDEKMGGVAELPLPRAEISQAPWDKMIWHAR